MRTRKHRLYNVKAVTAQVRLLSRAYSSGPLLVAYALGINIFMLCGQLCIICIYVDRSQ